MKDSRLERLMPALNARERAILVLRALQTGTPESPQWRTSMPRGQAKEFNHYIHLMNAYNIYLPLYITMVEQQVEQLWLRVYRLQSLLEGGRLFWELGKLIPPDRRAE